MEFGKRTHKDNSNHCCQKRTRRDSKKYNISDRLNSSVTLTEIVKPLDSPSYYCRIRDGKYFHKTITRSDIKTGRIKRQYQWLQMKHQVLDGTSSTFHFFVMNQISSLSYFKNNLLYNTLFYYVNFTIHGRKIQYIKIHNSYISTS